MRIRLESCVAALILSTIALPLSARAERLPLKSFSTADGLPHNTVNRIVRDSRGFLWLCTEEGLSRFDGYAFTNYGAEHGLPHTSINDLLETRAGEFWVATNGGLVRFNPKGTPSARVVYADDAATNASASLMFTTVVPQEEGRLSRAFSVLREGRDGTIWGGTLKGLYRLERTGAGYKLNPVDLRMPTETPMQRFISDTRRPSWGAVDRNAEWSVPPLAGRKCCAVYNKRRSPQRAFTRSLRGPRGSFVGCNAKRWFFPVSRRCHKISTDHRAQASKMGRPYHLGLPTLRDFRPSFLGGVQPRPGRVFP